MRMNVIGAAMVIMSIGLGLYFWRFWAIVVVCAVLSCLLHDLRLLFARFSCVCNRRVLSLASWV